MKLGIFLGYGPRQLDPHQGISRLITFIVKGALKSPDTRIMIAGSGWIKDGINEILDDAGIPRSSVEIVTTRGEPLALKIYEGVRKLRLRPPTARRRRRLALRAISKATEVVSDWLGTANPVVFVAGLAAFSLLAIVAAIPAAILLVLLGVFYAVRAAWRRFFRRYGHLINRTYRALFKVVMAVEPTERIRERELHRLVKLANRQKDINVWYVPSMFWPEVAKLRGKVVMGAPDIVFYEFPVQFGDESGRRALKRISGSLAAADHLICYSEHVKQKHLVQMNGVSPERISVIRHGIVDMKAAEEYSRQDALDVLHAYIEKSRRKLPDYLHRFRFDDVDFLFYSSQIRPYKNVEALARVYEKLLRERYRPLKLILTGNIHSNKRLQDFIRSQGLERDILSLHSVPNSVLGALYKLAALSVTPTQFEGGFPFTFSEAYSVGTPSVMSRIPVVTEMIDDPALLDRMTFLPHDQEDMLRKIVWGLDNRDELLRLQGPLYEQLSERSWGTVASEYLDVIKAVASG
ncbi:glycosyltransferase [Chelativorans sp. J32]|uniref:glycosyltransferase n=1 Tax=Chelativorans sp. J32 TaxID=935840 RepID=UPI0004AF9AA9|nr:glycosyltransferase [Chelativorans sp. J32]